MGTQRLDAVGHRCRRGSFRRARRACSGLLGIRSIQTERATRRTSSFCYALAESAAGCVDAVVAQGPPTTLAL